MPLSFWFRGYSDGAAVVHDHELGRPAMTYSALGHVGHTYAFALQGWQDRDEFPRWCESCADVIPKPGGAGADRLRPSR